MFCKIIILSITFLTAQFSHDVQAMLSQCCDNNGNYTILQCFQEVVTTLAECCVHVFLCLAYNVLTMNVV